MKKKANAFRHPGFWARVWEEARAGSDLLKKRIRTEEEVNAFWDRMAPVYEQAETADSRHDRVSRVLDLLEREELITGETRVLDIGCGPGTYALPFAARCKHITALDGAAEMCRQLENNALSLKLDNIVVINRLWEDVDLEGEGLNGQFDLVFASLSPAIFNLETLGKLNSASNKHCCLVTPAAEADNLARRELWEIVFKRKYRGSGSLPVVSLINLLFSLGYFPSVTFFDADHSRSDPVDEAVSRLCDTFWMFTELTAEVKEAITAYVRERAENGLFYHEIFVRLAMMTWQVDSRLDGSLFDSDSRTVKEQI